MVKALYIARAKKNPIFCSRPKKVLGYIGEVQDQNKSLVCDPRFRDVLGDEALIPKDFQDLGYPIHFLNNFQQIQDGRLLMF